MQHEITERKPLLNKNGDLAEPGFAKKLLPVYRRSDVKASKMRLKEWDYYLICNRNFGLALTIADNGYMGLDSVSFLNFAEKREKTVSPMRVFPMGKTGLPESSETGDSVISGKKYRLAFLHEGKARTLEFRMEDFWDGKAIEGKITLTDEPEESMVICTPFDKKKHFYYNQKINCMRADGSVKLGDETFRFDPADSFAVLDWGRGVWTYHNTWYWSSGSGLADGVPFGFNLGYGFGNTGAASENMLFYNGKTHKLGKVEFHIPQKDGKDDFMSPWKFTSDDGRFEADFTPILDRAACTDFKVLKSDQHQVFGLFNGKAVLDGGKAVEIKDFLAFAEKVENKW